jgi:uncharacterized membrane protein
MADDDERDDEQDYDDDDFAEDDEDEESPESSGDESSEASAGRNGKGGLVDMLMSQIGDHREVLAPVATSAAAAAATYAAKKLPELIDRFEQGGGDRIREKLGDASDGGGVKGFVSGAASRALSGGPGSLIESLKQGGQDEAESEAKESGGVTGTAMKLKDKLPGSGSKGGYGWGKGRRLPIVASVDVAAPIEVVYDQWTQFEEMGSFMHRVEGVEQKEPEKLLWHENIWGRKRNWNVQITEQVPRERIAWEIKGGGQGVGVITFHPLAPKLTRVELVFDWQPSGMVEKLGSGLRVHQRAAKTDLLRFKAFVETRGEATGGWRGRIEDGKAKADTRNRPNRDAEPIPSEARQHSEDEGKDNSDDNGDEPDEKAREAARAERRRHREERSRGQKRVKA